MKEKAEKIHNIFHSMIVGVFVESISKYYWFYHLNLIEIRFSA